MFRANRVGVLLASAVSVWGALGCGVGQPDQVPDGRERDPSAASDEAGDGEASSGEGPSSADEEGAPNAPALAGPSDDGSDPSPNGPTDTPADPEGPATSASGPGSDEPLCELREVTPEPVPLRRLTTSQFKRSLEVIFPGLGLPELSLPAPLVHDGFDNAALSQPNNPLLIDAEFAASDAVASAAVRELDSWGSCSAQTLQCLTELGLGVARSAFRRAPTSDEAERLEALMAESFAADGFEVALHDTLQAILLSPQTTYRVELGDGSNALTGEELATRLSFLLWRQAPDAALLAAAEAGELADAAGLEQHTRRLLDDERGRATIEDFVRQWLDTDRVAALQLDTTVYPELTPDLRAGLQESLERFVGWALWQENSLDALLGSDVVFVDDAVADLLGVPPPSEGFELAHVEHRHGLLTQPGLLAATSHGSVHSPILRGLKVLESFLCVPIGAPPPGAAAAIDPKPAGEALTTRQHVEQTHSSGSTCVGCHTLIDGVGFAFENYDALGRYTTHEDGIEVDSSGLVPLTTGLVDVGDAIELSQIVETSSDVRRCVSEHLYRYAFGVAPTGEGSQCLVDTLATTWTDHAGDPGALIRTLVTSPAFTTLASSNTASEGN